MTDYIINTSNPSDAWLFEYGDDNDVKYIRCPFCGCVIGLADWQYAPDKCPSCKEAVSGSDKVSEA